MSTLLFCRSPLALALALVTITPPLSPQEDPPPLMLAINEGDIAKVQELLEAGADPNLVFYDRTPLMFAAYGQHGEIFRLLVEKGADLEMRTERAGPLITIAAEGGSTELLGFLLERGADIDATQRHGQTALMLAVQNGHPDAVGFLLERGADPDIQEGSGWSALMFAAMQGDLASVNHLIAGGCDVHLRTTEGESPLDRARLLAEQNLGGGDYEGVVQALIGAGAGGS